MPIFLFLKQLVDMFYQYQILDYGMVLFALILLGYGIIKNKLYLKWKEYICISDLIVIALAVVYIGSWIRYPAAYGIFFKIESAILLYFIGRVYGSQIMSYGRWLAWAGYIVIYANFVYRFYQFDCKFILHGPEVTLLNVGGLYYYKTDLAVGVIIAVLFIYMFSESKILKWITIIPIAGYTVFYSGARMGQVVMAVEYGCILFHEIENKYGKEWIMPDKIVKRIMTVLIGVVVMFFVFLQVFSFEQFANSHDIETGAGSLLEKLMHSRQIIWWDILNYFSEQPVLTRIFGIDLQTEYMHNMAGMRAHSTYIKQIYATGYVGSMLFVSFCADIVCRITRESDGRLRYIVLILWVMLLGSGLSIESMESTQMSWFPMLYAGVLVSSTGITDQHKILELR